MQKLSLAGLLLATASTLTAQASTGYLVDSNSDQLFTVDIATGAATFIASTFNNGLDTPADLSWRSATNELWTIDLAGGEVGTIDVLTGAFTPVYQTNLSGWQGMTWDETTQMFYLANQSGSNYSLDPVSGVTTLLGVAGFSLLTSLDTDAAGNLFGCDFTTGALVSIDKVTGAGTLISTCQTTNIQGLGIDQATGVWYGCSTASSSLFSIDPLTGVSTLVGAHGAGITFAKGFDLIDGGGGNFATKTNYGTGCNNSYASFFESFGAFDLNNTTLSFTSTGTGYVVFPQAGTSTWHTPTSSAITIGDDQVVQFPLGWTLPYPGGSTTDVWVSSNGFVTGVANTLNGCCAFNQAQFLSAGPCWAALWDDLNPGAGGTVTFDSNPATGDAWVTFDNVPRYNTSNLNTFQYAFHASGQVELLWQTCTLTTCGVGWSPGLANANPGSMDISAAAAIITGPDTAALSLAASARPVIGTSVNLTLSNVPSGAPIAAFIFGLFKLDPGISLASIGMPGCFQYGSQEATALSIAPANTTSVVYSIPNAPWLVGVHVVVQGAVYNPAGNHNALGALSSNGVEFGFDVN
ncbi:MAG: hypothetical protein KA020_00390 [Planctomycetes bacterium]|jgi:hypothetical protein|nr:hypothetical protein [Planctomycetota bacterium]MCC7064466.1 hypothetical protein [Planctomycetota bacterium]